MEYKDSMCGVGAQNMTMATLSRELTGKTLNKYTATDS